MHIQSDTDALQRFETIWEHVDCGIAIIDATTREILSINPVAARMFGDDVAKILGKHCHKFICPAEEHSCPIMDKGQVVDRSERIFIKANGETIPIIKSVAKITYNGRLALLESFTDISKRKEAEEKLLQLHVAEEASRSKSEFLSRMSHEMRTPMNAVIGMTKVAAHTDDVAKLKYCLSMIDGAATHLLGLINDVLDMAKIEAGKFDLDSTPFNLEALLKKICHLVMGQMEEKGLSFRISLGGQMAERYLGDELRLSQIITNLLSNAVKFTPAGGAITLGVATVCRDDFSSVLRFTVTDTGIGMAPEQIDRLFNAFEQLDVNISRRFGGTGLGLVISKSIAEKMNGSITVRSTPNVGSTFAVDVTLGNITQQPDLATAREKALSGLKILVVDSDAASLADFDCLQAYAVTIDAVASGAEALALLDASAKAQKPYDAVFAGYDLQDIPFATLAKQCRETIEAGSLVFMGSFLQWTVIDKEDSGTRLTRFVPKPLFPSDIIKTLVAIRGAEKTEQAEQLGVTPDFSRITLLLAEDIALNREIFTALLEETGVNIVCAEDGRDAVAQFTADPARYDCIIMDLQMPGMDGYEATKTIREMETPWAKNVPIIAMTANVFQKDIERCLACGMNDHLAKPIDEQAVIEKIQRYCAAKCTFMT